MAREIRLGAEDILDQFAELEDPRSEINRRHPLESVIALSVMAVLAGASGPTGIAQWAKLKADRLEQVLPLPHGIPGKDVFRRALATLQPDAFQACFARWVQSLREAAAAASDEEQLVLAVDGKTLRRSHDRRNGLGPLHLVSVWASDLGLTLGQVATEEKSNEITAIPELLRLVDLSGAIITIDAMGTQTAIAKQIVDGGGDSVLAVKSNQRTLSHSLRNYVDEQMERDFVGSGARRHVTKETGHGREETRIYVQLPAPNTGRGSAAGKG